MSYASGDIVRISFPFSEGVSDLGTPQFKNRPAIVVAGPDAQGDFVMAAVSGESHHTHSVPIQPADLAQGRMTKASWVRADKLFTVNGRAVIESLARTKPELMARVRKQLCPAVGCK